MFTDEALKNSILKYYESSGATKNIDLEKAVADIRSKVKNNTMDELKLALRELKLEMSDGKSATASITFKGLLDSADKIISIALNMRQPVPIDEDVLTRVNNDLKALNSQIKIQKDTTAKDIENSLKSAKQQVSKIYKELDKLDNYDPMFDNNSSLEALLQNPQIMQLTEMDIPLLVEKRNSKKIPTAKMDNYNSKMPKKEKTLIDNTFGPIQWIQGRVGMEPVFPRKRIIFELLKGKSAGNIPGATGINGAYHRKMGGLKASKLTYEKIIAQLEGLLNNLWNRGKVLAVEQHIESELRTGFYHVENKFIKDKVAQLGEEMKQVISDIAKAKLNGDNLASSDHAQELYDALIEAGIEQDAQLAQRWLYPIGGKSNFNFLNEAAMFSSNFEPAFSHSNVPDMDPVRPETTLGTSHWQVPDMAQDDPAQYEISKMPTSFTKGRVIYDYLTKDDSNEKVVDDYKWIINKSESRQAQDSRNNYVSFGATPISKLQLANQEGLHWKIYWALSRAEAARDQELAGDSAPMKQYSKSSAPLVRLALTKNTSVPDFVLMYMVQYDDNNVVRSEARKQLYSRGLQVSKDSAGNPMTQEIQPGVKEYVWAPVTPKKKQKASFDPWLSYFAAESMSGSDRLQGVQQQQALDLAAKTEAQTAQKKAEEDKKLLLQQQQKKSISDRDPVSQPNPPQAPDATETQGVKPGSKLPPQMAIASISKRDSE